MKKATQILGLMIAAVLMLSLVSCGSSIKAQLETLGKEKNVTFEVLYDNCNADSNVLTQIIANFISEKVDLMVGIATPVAMAMQSATEDNKIPVVFAAVSDPVGTQLVDSLEAPGSNLTGSSDYLDTTAVMNLIAATAGGFLLEALGTRSFFALLCGLQLLSGLFFVGLHVVGIKYLHRPPKNKECMLTLHGVQQDM